MRTTAAICAVALATLTGCTEKRPAPAATDAAPAHTLSRAQVGQQCVDAIANRATKQTGNMPFEPAPHACLPLSDSEYLDAYMRGLRQHNQAGRDELQRQLDEATQ
ncbi:hypothetical protein ACFWAT_20700 [Streptomyces syringium]|uniref:hypothetical protein n=1 Tax=Streptomyces syringium TaxID=76729 RepID=UPI00365B5F7C